MSNLSELLPTGGGQNAVDFVASGTLSSGQAVALKTDGTVEVISTTPVAGTPSFGSEVLYNGNIYGSQTVVGYDTTNNKILICFTTTGSNGWGIVGTVSGTSITFGSATQFNTGSFEYGSIAFTPASDKFVIAYKDGSNSSYGTCIVATISGTSVSFGSKTIISSATTYFTSTVYDPTGGRVWVSYATTGTGIDLKSGTISGTTFGVGSATNISSGFGDSSLVYDTNADKLVTVYRDGTNSNYGTAKVGTISGTSISFGSATVYNSAYSEKAFSAFDSSANKVVIAYRNANNGDKGYGIVGTVSGTSISFGTTVLFNDAVTNDIVAIYDTTYDRIVITYKDGGNGDYGTLIVGTVSGTSISFGSEAVFNPGNSNNPYSVYDPDNGVVVIGYSDAGNSSYGTAIVGAIGSEVSNSADFIGITAGAISDTATGAVNVYGGINEAQTGLTIGADYYVQDDGSISTTSSAVKIGQAISATTINMMDLT